MPLAALLTAIGAPLEVCEVEVDDPAPGEVLVDVRASGLCHSDLTFADHDFGQRTPLLLGHEVAGVVRAVGDGVSLVAPGDHVATCLAGNCGFCRRCSEGRSWMCREQRRLGRPRGAAPRVRRGGERVVQSAHLGGLAEQLLISELAAVAVPPSVPFEIAAVLGCSVVTGVGAATHVADIRLGDTVVVIGCGGVGLNVILGARRAGAGRIVAVDLQPSKEPLVRRFGADDLVSEQDAVAAVRELCDGGADHVFEVVGSAATAAQGVAMTGVGGTTYLVGVPTPGSQYSFDAADLIFSGKTVRAVLMGGTRFRVDIPRYADEYLAGRLELDQLVDRRLDLVSVNEGFELMRAGASARSVVMFG